MHLNLDGARTLMLGAQALLEPPQHPATKGDVLATSFSVRGNPTVRHVWSHTAPPRPHMDSRRKPVRRCNLNRYRLPPRFPGTGRRVVHSLVAKPSWDFVTPGRRAYREIAHSARPRPRDLLARPRLAA